VNRITFIFDDVSLNQATDSFLIQLGDSVGFETTGYDSDSLILSFPGTISGSSNTTGFVIRNNVEASETTGTMTLTRMSGNKWISNHTMHTVTNIIWGAGDKTLSDELTQVRLTRTGSNTFDNGNVTISFE